MPALLGVVALISILLAGCANANVLGTQRDPNQVFVFPNTAYEHPLPLWHSDGTSESGYNLDPAYLSDLYSQIVDSMLQIQLVSFDQNLSIVPDAAQTWDISSDRTTWTFHLRTGLKWADGTPITAQDFALGMQHDLDPNLCTTKGPLNAPGSTSCAGGQLQLTYLQNIQGAVAYANQTPDPTTGKIPTSVSGITVVDPQTLKIQLTAPIAFFLGTMATPASMPIETSAFQKYGFDYVSHFADATHPSQSGPFMVQAWANPAKGQLNDAQHSTEIDYVPNPNWWGKPLSLKEVKMPLIPIVDDWYTRYQDTGTNEIDYAQVPSSELPFTQNLPDFHAVPQLTIEFFGMNFVDPPFDNLQVRQAFDLSLNKQSLVDTVFQGADSPTNHIIPQGIPGANPDLLTPPSNGGSVSLTGNQAEAQKLIAGVAAGCQQDSSSNWCPYIVGTGTPNKPVSSVGAGGSNCPNYAVNTSGGASTQKPIAVFVALNNPDRVNMAKGAAQGWSNVLCLNVVANATSNFSQLIGEVYGDAGQGKPTAASMWTIGYGVDYIDPQDFTTNQFAPQSPNNAANFGVNNPNANDNALQLQIVKQMQAADIMPYNTAAEKAARIQAYQQIEQSLVDEVAWIPYDQAETLYRVRSYVTNFQLPANGFLSDQDWADIYIAAHN
jgi:peptide/nickel transport system substrate-binding protein/oligopeptide transport system substrate-binding protein